MPKTRIHSLNKNIGGIINAKDDTGIPESFLAYAKNVIGRPLGSMSNHPKLLIDSNLTILIGSDRIAFAIDFITPDGVERSDLIDMS